MGVSTTVVGLIAWGGSLDAVALGSAGCVAGLDPIAPQRIPWGVAPAGWQRRIAERGRTADPNQRRGSPEPSSAARPRMNPKQPINCSEVAAGLMRPLRGTHWLFGREAGSIPPEELAQWRLPVGLVFGED